MRIFRKPNQGMFFNWWGYPVGIVLVALFTVLIYLIPPIAASVHNSVLYILAILPVSIYFGIGPAIVTSILSVMAYDFFFIDPLFTIGPRNIQDVPILVIFLIVGIITSFLASNLRHQSNEAKNRAAALQQRETELTRTSDQLRESEEKFRNMVETAGEGIVMLNSQEIINYVNKRFLDMLGYSVSEMLGKPICNFADQDYADDLKRRLGNRRMGVGEGYELAYRRKDGSRLWVKIYGSPLFDSKGNYIGTVGMHTDITAEKNLRDQLEDYAKRLIQIQEEERKRIARELHDDTAPALAYLTLELDAIMMKSPNLSAESIARLKELREKIDTTQQNIRRFSHELHPAILDNLGLEPALEALIDEFNSRGRLEIKFSVFGQPRELPDEVKLALYRITQEALNNIWKHSQASEARVSLGYYADSTALSITDNGIGFNASNPVKSGLGLTGIRERADLIDGKLQLESTIGKGTAISIKVDK